MKMRIILSLLSLFFITSAVLAADTLYEYYAERGQRLPSIAERAKIAEQFGIDNYQGTYEQNVKLLALLQGSEQGITPLLGGSNPITATDWQLASSISTSDTTLKLTSFDDLRGNTPSVSDFPTKIYLGIEPNNPSNFEIVVCPRSGLDIANKTLSNCTRGLPFYGSSETSVTSNKKSHPAGSKVIMTNVGQFYNMFVDIYDDNTIYGQITFTTTTSPITKVFLGPDGAYLWYSTSTKTIGFASSTASGEFAFNTNGTTFTPITPLELTAGELKLATSTNDFTLSSGKLAINASSTGGIASDSNGLYVDTSDDFSWTGENTFNATTTFNTIPTLPNSNPTSDNQAVRKAYVDSLVGCTFGTVSIAPGNTGIKYYSHDLGSTPGLMSFDAFADVSGGLGNSTGYSTSATSTQKNIWGYVSSGSGTEVYAGSNNGSVVYLMNYTGSVYVKAILWSATSTGFALNWTTNGSGGGNRYVIYKFCR